MTFLGTFNGAGIHPESKRYIIGFNGEAAIKRSAFGITAAPVIGDEVRLTLEAEFLLSSDRPRGWVSAWATGSRDSCHRPWADPIARRIFRSVRY